MDDPTPSLADLTKAWGDLWQAGFATVWNSYAQWLAAVGAYRVGQDQVGQTPAEQVWRYGRSRLIRYTPTTDTQSPIPVLCVPSLINRYYILDLLPERSLVAYLVSRGLTVYMLDWGRPSPADTQLSLDDHIAGYLHRAVKAVQADSGGGPISLLGYCMGGMFTAVYTSLFGDQVANLVNLAGPIGYHDDGIFSLLTRSDWFDADKLVDTYGNIPADLLLWAFQMIRPTANLIRALYLYERMEDADFVRNFAAMQTWIFDQVDFPGETFRRYVKTMYQENQLVNDQFTIHDQPVRLDQISCPLLNIASRHDETAPYPSVQVLNDKVNSKDKTLLLLKGPHVGMVAGRSAPKHLWPPLADWLIEHSH